MDRLNTTPAFTEEKLGKLHAILKGMVVQLPESPSVADIRRIFSEIRKHRNTCAKILVAARRKAVRLKADQVRLERMVEAESSDRLAHNRGFMGADTVKKREAKLKYHLSHWLQEIADCKMRSLAAEELEAHAKVIREELKMAFEETSRCLASLEFEYRVQSNAP